MRCSLVLVIWVAAMFLSSCSTTVESVKPPAPSPLPEKEMLYTRGHQLYLQAQYDSASVLLTKALTIDGKYLPALSDLAEMHYTLAVGGNGEARADKQGHLKLAQQYYQKMEVLGRRDADLYERLCEITHAAGDDEAFLKYAKKNADAYPYDRQFYNLGIAYLTMNDFQSVIRTQKVAIEKFTSSPLIGSFYKQLGRAYMKIDRDQTAERTFTAGIQAVDARLAGLKKGGGDEKSTDNYHRLMDDKIGMLLFLKKLHQTYGAKEKLAQVERQLKEAGYTR